MTYGYIDPIEEPQANVSQREHDALQAKVTELEVELNELRRELGEANTVELHVNTITTLRRELGEAKKLCAVQLKNIHLYRESNKRRQARAEAGGQ